MRSWLIIILSLLGTQTRAQELTLDDFLAIVKAHHPIAYRADLAAEAGVLKVKKAKGAFDPKLEGRLDQKYFDDQTYYSRLNAGMKVPTWFGITAGAGFQQNEGVQLNPERLTPDPGLWYAGLQITLGNGLFIDQRRAELKQAKIFQNSSELKQRLMLNQLLFDAKVAYWDWFKIYNKQAVYIEALTNAEFRLNAIRSSAEFGDKPYVDTLKGVIQVQNRNTKLTEFTYELQNKINQMEVFLWKDGFIPLELDTLAQPGNFRNFNPDLPDLIDPSERDSILQNHPELLYAENDIDIAEINFRIKREQLKPDLTLKYNALNSGAFDNYNVENYTWGATVSYAPFTRKERAEANLARVKLEDQKAKLADKRAVVGYKLDKSYNDWISSRQQVDIYRLAEDNYRRLYEAEFELFNNGESSLFLVNVRDQDWIEARIKLIDLLFDTQVAKAAFYYQIVRL
jgi:outer membrane protein TolC